MHLVWRVEIFCNLAPKYPSQDQINKRHCQDAHGTSGNQRFFADIFLLSKTKKRGFHAVCQKNSNHSRNGVPIHKDSAGENALVMIGAMRKGNILTSTELMP